MYFFIVLILSLPQAAPAKSKEFTFKIKGPFLNYNLYFADKRGLEFKSKFYNKIIDADKCALRMINDIKNQFLSIHKVGLKNKGMMKSFYQITLNGKTRYFPLNFKKRKTIRDFPSRAMSLSKELGYLCKK